MPTHPIVSIIDGQPCFEKTLDEIFLDCKKGGAIKILSPLEFITDRQRRWFKGIALRDLVKNDENGETMGWWDTEVKKKCNGLALLKIEYIVLEDGSVVSRLTTKGVGKRKMSQFIEEILSKRAELGWEVSEPDPELRKNK